MEGQFFGPGCSGLESWVIHKITSQVEVEFRNGEVSHDPTLGVGEPFR